MSRRSYAGWFLPSRSRRASSAAIWRMSSTDNPVLVDAAALPRDPASIEGTAANVLAARAEPRGRPACAGANDGRIGCPGAGGGTGAAADASRNGGAPAASRGNSQPDGISTGCVTRRVSPFSFTTLLSTATYAVNRLRTPNRSDVETIRDSRSRSPAAYRSSRSRIRARAHWAGIAGSSRCRTVAAATNSRSSRVRPITVIVPVGVPAYRPVTTSGTPG
jgi:hypothetical protein